jgi:hypothetical protein
MFCAVSSRRGQRRSLLKGMTAGTRQNPSAPGPVKRGEATFVNKSLGRSLLNNVVYFGKASIGEASGGGVNGEQDRAERMVIL